MKPGAGNRSGFTIVEVILGMFILSLILIGLSGAMFSFVQTNKRSRDIANATSIGNKLLEKVRMKSYDDIQADSGPVGENFWQTTLVTEDTVGTRKDIEIIVSWPQTTATNSITLETIVAKR